MLRSSFKLQRHLQGNNSLVKRLFTVPKEKPKRFDWGKWLDEQKHFSIIYGHRDPRDPRVPIEATVLIRLNYGPMFCFCVLFLALYSAFHYDYPEYIETYSAIYHLPYMPYVGLAIIFLVIIFAILVKAYGVSGMWAEIVVLTAMGLAFFLLTVVFLIENGNCSLPIPLSEKLETAFDLYSRLMDSHYRVKYGQPTSAEFVEFKRKAWEHFLGNMDHPSIEAKTLTSKELAVVTEFQAHNDFDFYANEKLRSDILGVYTSGPMLFMFGVNIVKAFFGL